MHYVLNQKIALEIKKSDKNISDFEHYNVILQTQSCSQVSIVSIQYTMELSLHNIQIPFSLESIQQTLWQLGADFRSLIAQFKGTHCGFLEDQIWFHVIYILGVIEKPVSPKNTPQISTIRELVSQLK